MPTVLPFHRAVVADPAFAPADPAEPFSVHTRWIETEFDNTIPPYAGAGRRRPRTAATRERVDGRGRRQAARGRAAGRAGRRRGPAPAGGRGRASRAERGARRKAAAATGDALTSPMQGTIVKVAVEEGQHGRRPGDLVVVLEAMKMEQPLTAHKAGTVTGLSAEVGATVSLRRRALRDQGLIER